MLDVWLLKANPQNALSLSTDLDFFSEKFDGRSMALDWVQPETGILGRSKKVKDFVSWMLCAPVVSEFAKECLEPIIGDYCEFLPLITVKNKKLYAINVLKLIECIDLEKSDIGYLVSNPKKISRISKYFFYLEKLEDVPIFKTKEYPSHVFVRRKFADVVINNNLTGSVFIDPSVNPFDALLKGVSGNVLKDVKD